MRLDAVAEIKGINNLGPRKALELGTQPMTIVYGLSGSASLVYANFEGGVVARRASSRFTEMYFEERPDEQCCKIAYNVDGAKKEIVWFPGSGVNADLAAISLYDTDCAHVYVNEENQVTYEPPVLRLFRVLVEACVYITRVIDAETAKDCSSKPRIDAALVGTTSGLNGTTGLTARPSPRKSCSDALGTRQTTCG